MTASSVTSPAAPLPAVTSQIGRAERWDHILARIGYKRMGHLVEPGLYRLGNPGPEAPVLVSANYTLSFDSLRGALQGVDAFILVLDTKGVNVWCAAGEGTFGTDELVRRIELSGLAGVVKHRRLILPQLGGPGVSAHQVKQRSGFTVEYGPVRAADVKEYLKTGSATPEMRLVRFPLAERMKVSLVDFTAILLPMLIAAVVLFFMGGWWGAAAVVAAVLSGTLLFPALLPYLPTNKFSTKGFFLGAVVALPFVIYPLLDSTPVNVWQRTGSALAAALALPALIAYLSLLYTGSTTFTSRTGVKREIATYFPVMAWMFVSGLLLELVIFFVNLFGRMA